MTIVRHNQPKADNFVEVRRVLNVRHKEIAHSALNSSYERAKWSDVDWAIQYANRFAAALAQTYANRKFGTNGNMFWDSEINRTIFSFRRLAHKAGAIVDEGLARHDDELNRLS